MTLYLRGVFLLNNQPDQWQDACRAELERAISLSPRFAAAHAALSRWYNVTGRIETSDGVVDHRLHRRSIGRDRRLSAIPSWRMDIPHSPTFSSSDCAYRTR